MPNGGSFEIVIRLFRHLHLDQYLFGTKFIAKKPNFTCYRVTRDNISGVFVTSVGTIFKLPTLVDQHTNSEVPSS